MRADLRETWPSKRGSGIETRDAGDARELAYDVAPGKRVEGAGNGAGASKIDVGVWRVLCAMTWQPKHERWGDFRHGGRVFEAGKWEGRGEARSGDVVLGNACGGGQQKPGEWGGSF